ncbi:MAG: hypothetical protein QM482_08255 [Sulfurospirillum sp.]
MITTTNNKSAYILMEVIISIIILSVVGISLLRVNSNEKRLYMISDSKLKFLKYVSIPLNQHSMDLHNKESNLYDLLKNRYDFKSDLLIKELKNTKVMYKQKYKSMVNFIHDESSVNLLIDQITLKNRSATSNFLTVKK